MKTFTEQQLPQGSEQWLQLRKQYGTASEAASAMGVSPWIPKTPLQLWELKNGELEIKMNFAMQMGSEKEDEAREYYQNMSGKIYEPVCIVGEIEGLPLMASLDGKEVFTGGNSIVEIKCPLKGSDSPLWLTMIEERELPLQYQIQMEQQMMLAGVDECNFFVYCFHNQIGIHRVHMSNPGLRKDIIAGWKEYFKGKPKPGPKDTVKRDDDKWKNLAKEYKGLKQLKDDADARLKELKKDMIYQCDGQSMKGAGVRCRQSEKTGNWTISTY